MKAMTPPKAIDTARVSMAAGGNILDLGQRVSARMAEIMPTLPLGVSAAAVNDQPLVVAKDVGVFEESFLEALAIVLLVSFISLGWRTGIVVAISVPLVLAELGSTPADTRPPVI